MDEVFFFFFFFRAILALSFIPIYLIFIYILIVKFYIGLNDWAMKEKTKWEGQRSPNYLDLERLHTYQKVCFFPHFYLYSDS